MYFTDDDYSTLHLEMHDIMCKWVSKEGYTVALILPGWQVCGGAKIYFLKSQEVLDVAFPLMELEGVTWEVRVFDRDGHIIYKDHSKSHFTVVTDEYCKRWKDITTKADELFKELDKKIKHEQDLAKRRARRAANKKIKGD